MSGSVAGWELVVAIVAVVNGWFAIGCCNLIVGWCQEAQLEFSPMF